MCCRSCCKTNVAPGHLHECENDHASEAQSMEDLGRLLGEVKSCSRSVCLIGLLSAFSIRY